jgi:hypothetical protein
LKDYILRVESFLDRYGLQALVLFAGFLLIFLNVIFDEHGVQGVTLRLALMLSIGVFIHSFYWICLSIGWVRYAFYIVILFCFLVAICCEFKSVVGLSGMALCIYLWGHNWPRLAYVKDASSQMTNGDTSEMFSAHQVLGFIQSHKIEPPVYTGWWADVAALEYLAPKPNMFMGYQVALQTKAWPITLLTNDKFPVENQDFKELLGRCHAVLERRPYTLYVCGRGSLKK